MGFSAQVQQGQTGGGGKNGPLASAAQQMTDTTQPTPSNPQPLDGINNGYFPQAPKPMGKGGVQTHSATSGQPTMGAPNQYPNTVGQWDNTQIQPVRQQGKGKGV